MAGATLTTLSNILKDFYLPPVVEQLNNEVLLLQRLETRGEDLFGNQAVVPVHSGRSGGIGARAEGASLPAAGDQGYEKATYDLKYLYGRISVTGPARAKTRAEAGAFLEALKSELDGIRNDLRKDVARQVYGSSDGSEAGNGLIAKCGTTSNSADVVLDSDEALRKGHIYVGMVVDVGTTGDTDSLIAGEEVTAVDIANKTMTVSTAITTTTSNFVSRAGSAGNEILGLQTIVDTSAGTSVGGLDPDTVGDFWENQRDTDGGALALDTLSQAFNTVRVQGGNVSLMISSFGLQRALFNLLQAQVRYMDPMNLKGGFQALEYMGRPFIADVDHPFGKIHLLDERFLKVFSNRDWHFLDEDGHILKWVTGFDKWEAVLARFMEIGVTRRNVQMVISGLTDATGV